MRPHPVNRMGVKMAAAFAVVAALSVAAVGVAARVAVRAEFGTYLFQVRELAGMPPPGMSPPRPAPAPGWVPPPDDTRPPAPPLPEPVRRSWMRAVLGPRWAAALRVMMGRPERRFLERVEGMLWRVAVVAALFGAGTGAVMARGMSQRLDRLARRALARARGASRDGIVAAGDEIDQLDAAFSAMERALDEEDRLRRRLLTDIAHDLKTPLAVVRANLEAMLDGVMPASPERLAAVHAQVALLGRLVNDLRDLALAEAGQLALSRRPTDMAQLLRQIVDLWQPQAQEKGVRVDLDVEPVPAVHADPDRIGQVVLNLLSNALRHAPAGTGVIRVRAAADGEHVLVDVEDNGQGIPPADLPHIFDHFYRGDPSRARSTGGFGVGLAIVKSLVEAHGGFVRAENLHEGGARFRFGLPVAPAVAAL